MHCYQYARVVLCRIDFRSARMLSYVFRKLLGKELCSVFPLPAAGRSRYMQVPFQLHLPPIQLGTQPLSYAPFTLEDIPENLRSKLPSSGRPMPMNQFLTAAFLEWKRRSQFAADEDWIFASPYKFGRDRYLMRMSGMSFNARRRPLSLRASELTPFATATGLGWMRSVLRFRCSRSSCDMPTFAQQ